jgi:hypothetical protein
VTILLALALAACRIHEPFPCALDEHCGPSGRCEPAGFCSFPDPACGGGRRYDELAGGDLAGQCVTSSACPARYAITLPVGGSRYRTVAVPTTGPDAQADCAADGGGSHLAVIGCDAERTGAGALVGGDFWIGLSDRVAEGTFRWVTPAGSTFTAWAGGQPDDPDGTEDCVEQRPTMMAGWHDQPCTKLLAYVCECDGVASAPAAY